MSCAAVNAAALLGAGSDRTQPPDPRAELRCPELRGVIAVQRCAMRQDASGCSCPHAQRAQAAAANLQREIARETGLRCVTGRSRERKETPCISCGRVRYGNAPAPRCRSCTARRRQEQKVAKRIAEAKPCLRCGGPLWAGNRSGYHCFCNPMRNLSKAKRAALRGQA